MNRREFVRQAALTAAGLWVLGPWEGALPAPVNKSLLRLALLADAHLKDGNEERPEAKNLARAVSEIKAVSPAFDLVLFAGDLAHHGNPKALALGREILYGLSAPLLAARGEGDGGPESLRRWVRHIGTAPFFYEFKGTYLLGLDTGWQSFREGPAFALGETQRRWLGETLPRLDPKKPLLVLSHAPLTPIFPPWGQWIRDAAELAPILARFPRVICLHGHGHYAGSQGDWPISGKKAGRGGFMSPKIREDRKVETGHLSLPATSWPYPSPLEGTTLDLRPGLLTRGCGWLEITGTPGGWWVIPHIWET